VRGQGSEGTTERLMAALCRRRPGEAGEEDATLLLHPAAGPSPPPPQSWLPPLLPHES
jgi:hypothetical protein